MAQWNLWHGCRKLSAGCKNCYVYRFDAAFNRDASSVSKTADYNLPLNENATARINYQSVKRYILVLLPTFFLRKRMSGGLTHGK
jgi:protein gp37